MNYIKRFLQNNFELNLVYRNVFNSKPMLIDHIAHRTFAEDKVATNYLKNFSGYFLKNDKYNFQKHNATAEWLDFEGNKFDNSYYNNLKLQTNKIYGTPRVFISTYCGVYNDENLKNSNIDLDLVNYHIKNKNEKISYDLYKNIKSYNQYLAWTLVFRNKINHIGFEVDDIQDILQKVSNILPINNPEYPIQVSEDGNLLQFSTASALYPFKFKEGNYEIPKNFIEFVQRKNNREGFSEKNANIVFDSTNGK